MRLLLLLGLAGWFEGVTPTTVATDLKLIEDLDQCVQTRFQEPAPQSLGMSRVALPASFGQHFRPNLVTQRDFDPANEPERNAIAALEDRHMQVGFYLVGRAIASSSVANPNYRALKGPGAMTRGTPRPAWYPGTGAPAIVVPDALPDWQAIYSLGRKAMLSFEDGGKGFETTLNSWKIAARPVMASEARCVSCHNVRIFNPVTNTLSESGDGVKLNQAIGGVLYAYRRTD